MLAGRSFSFPLFLSVFLTLSSDLFCLDSFVSTTLLCEKKGEEMSENEERWKGRKEGELEQERETAIHVLLDFFFFSFCWLPSPSPAILCQKREKEKSTNRSLSSRRSRSRVRAIEYYDEPRRSTTTRARSVSRRRISDVEIRHPRTSFVDERVVRRSVSRVR